MTLRFKALLNSLDPQTTDEGEPYGPIRFKQISIECFRISARINTSYSDLLSITPIERQYILEELKAEDDAIKDMANNKGSPNKKITRKR